MSRKPQESIREFAQRWMLVADQVKPPLEDKEMANEFLNTLKPEYHERLASHINYDIFEMVEAVERMEKRPQVSRSSDSTREEKNNFRKREDSVNVLSTPANSGPSNQQNRFHPRNNFNPRPPAQSTNYNPASAVSYQPNSSRPTPAQAAQQRRDSRFRHFDTFPISYAELFRQLAAQEMISPVIPKPVSNPPPRSYNPNLHCLYHSNAPGHDTENCTALKNSIKDLYEDGKLKFDETPVQPRGPNTPRIPLPYHNARH